MKRKLEMIIEGTCQKCPFFKYKSDYILGEEPGYICNYPGNNMSMIISNNMIRENKTLREIPNDCPLNNLDE